MTAVVCWLRMCVFDPPCSMQCLDAQLHGRRRKTAKELRTPAPDPLPEGQFAPPVPDDRVRD